jgi:cytochrome c
MTKHLAVAAGTTLALGFLVPVAAQHNKHANMNMHGTEAQAVAMVKKGVAFIQAFGVNQTYARINDSKGQFRDRSLYLVVYDLEGKVLAHGYKPGMIGKNMFEFRDPGGNQYIRETVERARAKDKFWIEHTMDNPMTGQVEDMRMYCEKVEQTVICSGHFMG